MALVKLTIFPEPREIPDDEIPALRAQGLVEDTPAAPPPSPAATDARPAAKEPAK